MPRSWPILPVGDKGAVIFGENGSGKSSLIDALEYGLTGHSTLYAEDRMGVNWVTGSPHLVDGAPDIAVVVSDGPDEFELRFDDVPDTLSPQGRTWIDSAARASFVLRRHMLLSFIGVQPRDRYNLLEPFLALGQYSVIEDALRLSLNRFRTEHFSIDGEISRLTTTLRSVFQLSTGDNVDRTVILAKINRELVSLGLPAISETNTLDHAQAAVNHVLGDRAKSDRIATIAALKLQMQRLPTVESLLPLLDGYNEAAQSLETDVAGRAGQVITELLRESRDIISTSALATCPVCEQEIDRDAVVLRLNARIESDAKITAARHLKRERSEAAIRAMRTLQDALHRLSQEWNSVVGSPVPPEFTRLSNTVDAFLSELDADTINAAKGAELHAQLISASFPYEAHIGLLEERLASEGEGERRRIASVAFAFIDSALKDLTVLEAAHRKRKKVISDEHVVERLYGHAVDARKAGVQSMLDTVSATANRYYSAIHPDEDIGESSLAVRDAATSSVNLSTIFHGHEEPPLLHFSESHLDTLGLCYFLALRKHETARLPTYKVLVLDDVMHSVDAEHRSRVAQLLKSEFSDHQLIVTTHDDFFYEVLHQVLGSGFAYHRIANWDLSAGPVLADPSTDLDIVLEAKGRASRRPADLSSACGRFLEGYLKQIAERLEISVPARFSRKADIGSLWPPVASKLLARRSFADLHGPAVRGLTANAWVRNACGAHHNVVASAVTGPEATELAEHIATVYTATHCETCGSTIAKRDNENWTCNCGAIAYRS